MLPIDVVVAVCVFKKLSLMLHRGDCHCENVRFECDSEPDAHIHRCNCSICDSVGYVHLIIPRSAFNLILSWHEITIYRLHIGVTKQGLPSTIFGKICGVKPR